ncbi:MAG: flagellar protein FliS [Candidatus Omnitrophica bacterium]|nr:flagellar protein FliS [Candidatus Omnitrophota bacterium]MCM8827509.1 flagellar protein FliS [Candidatus Omnitrophota bacterium]
MDESKKYKLEKLKSCSDLEALIMLYDEMVICFEEAKELFKLNKYEEFIEKIDWIKKIIEGLMRILNFDIDANLAGNLYRIYDYVLRRLTVAQAIIRQTPKIVDECYKIISDLRDGWVKVKEKGDITEEFREHLVTQEKNFLNIQI